MSFEFQLQSIVLFFRLAFISLIFIHFIHHPDLPYFLSIVNLFI